MDVKEALLQTVSQVVGLLEQLEPHEYRQPLPEYEGSTLGQHFRHILEFFICLERGVPAGVVDYAARERNLLFEDTPGIAINALLAFEETLEQLNPTQPIFMRAEFDGAHRPQYQSTVGRELAFVFDHAIHHLAIIKIGIRVRFPHLQLERNLGVSPSTIKARRTTG